MWRAGSPDPVDIKRMRAAREKHDLHPLVIHDNYLINLASSEPVIRAQSIAAFRGELERALAIGADYLVAHPGSYKGKTCEQGILHVAHALIEASRGLKSRSLTILLENTAGSGCAIGSRFEELSLIRRLAEEHVGFRIGYCLDTCHCLASNYDVASPDGLRQTVKSAELLLGMENVHVVHTNDSKFPLGSRVDRHQHIGEGYIKLDGFRRILTHPKLRRKAFILETPVDREGDERRNLDTLKSLCRKSSTTTKKSS